MTGEADPTLGEIARRLDEVFTRFERLVADMPRQFVNRDLFDSYKELAVARDTTLQQAISDGNRRVKQLEDDKTWLYRLIIGAVILALMSLSFTVARTLASSGGPSQPGSSTHSSTVTP